jgi:hypothetical protein
MRAYGLVVGEIPGAFEDTAAELAVAVGVVGGAEVPSTVPLGGAVTVPLGGAPPVSVGVVLGDVEGVGDAGLITGR